MLSGPQAKLEKSREQLAQQLGLSASSRRSLLSDLVQQRLSGGAPSVAQTSSSSLGARSTDAKGAGSTSAVGAPKSKERVFQSARSMPESSRSDGAEYKDDFDADSRCAHTITFYKCTLLTIIDYTVPELLSVN